MLEYKMRAILIDGQRRGIRLDTTTWEAIDWLAAKQKRKWTKWAVELAHQYPDAVNLTAIIREVAIEELLKEITRRDVDRKFVIDRMTKIADEINS